MQVQSDIALADWCTLGVGGAARWFVRAGSEDEVMAALAWARERGEAVHVLGGGSNVVIADRGFDGLVLQVAIVGIDARDEQGRVAFRAGAGEPWDEVVARTVDANCAGLECLSGIPGLVGGTPVQNVGAYGQDVSDTLTSVRVVHRREGRALSLAAAECGFGYRTSRFKREDSDAFIVTQVEFSLRRGGPPTLAYADVQKHFEDRAGATPTLSEVRQAVLDIRRKKGMVIEPGNPANRSVGSFFVNPVIGAAPFERLCATLGAPRNQVPHYRVGDAAVKVPAAWLIERAGFTRGLVRGRVGISPFQAQAIVNHGGASAEDVLALAVAVKTAVWNAFAIGLVPEPVFVGFDDSPALRWLRAAAPTE